MSRPRGFRLNPLVLALAALVGQVPTVAQATLFTVTSTLDDSNPNLIGNGTCELREALTNANLDAIPFGWVPGDCPGGAGADTIAFNIPGAGIPHFIEINDGVAGDLPAIVSEVHIDGYTQPGTSVNTNGAGNINAVLMVGIRRTAGTAANGLNFSDGSSNSSVRGLVVNGFGTAGMVAGAGSLTFAGNFIGTNAAGVADFGNGYGILISANANDLTIGGMAAADRNLIAGNNLSEVAKVGNGEIINVVIRGNLIGTQSDGVTPIETNGVGIYLLDSSAFMQGNIVGAMVNGIWIAGQGASEVSLNNVGVGADGASDIGGTGSGITVTNAGSSDPLVDLSNNLVANWGGNGVLVVSSDPAAPHPRVPMYANSIHDNGGRGIELVDAAAGDVLGADVNDPLDADVGPSGHHNYPVVTAASTDGVNTEVEFTFHGTPLSTIHVEFFSSPTCDADGYGEGRNYLGSVDIDTDAGGDLSLTAATVQAATPGHFLTMTAGTPSVGTSEFSACLTIAAAEAPPVMGDVPNQTGAVGMAFNLELAGYVTPTDGDPITSYAIASGSLPPGLSFDPATGAISGTPTMAGVYNVTVTATDDDGASTADAVQFTIDAAVQTPPIMGDVPDQTGSVGGAFNLALAGYVTLTDGDPVMNYAVASGALPPGLSLDPATGVISGTPTTVGLYDLTVTATDNDGASNADAVNITISALPVPMLAPWALTMLAALLAGLGIRSRARPLRG